MPLVLCGQCTLLPATEEDWHIDQLIESFTSFFVQFPNTRTACLVSARHTMDIQQWQHHLYAMIPVSSKEQTSFYPLMCSVGTVLWRKEAHVEGGAVSTMREARDADFWGLKDLKEEAFWKESSKCQGPVSPWAVQPSQPSSAVARKTWPVALF